MSDMRKADTPDVRVSGQAPESPARAAARQRIEKRRRLLADVVAYLVINAFLVLAWAVTGMGYFWPGWVMAGWGTFLLLAGWDVYGRRPVSEADIEAELRRRQGS